MADLYGNREGSHALKFETVVDGELGKCSFYDANMGKFTASSCDKTLAIFEGAQRLYGLGLFTANHNTDTVSIVHNNRGPK